VYFFADDIQANSNKSPVGCDIFYYGGFLVKENEVKILENKIKEVKNRFNIPSYLPLKWNLKDSRLVKFYKKHGKQDILQKIIPSSYEIRKYLLRNISESNIKIIISGFRSLKLFNKSNRVQCLTWAFTNILQRVPFEQSGDSPFVKFILDWEGNNRDVFLSTYHRPYHEKIGCNGETFYPPCIEKICNGLPFISFSSTLYNPFLQLADIIVGACSAFLEYAYKDKDPKLAKEIFPLVAPKIRGFSDGDIFSWGFLVRPERDKHLIERKFYEII